MFRDIISAVINVIIWLIFYNPCYLVGNMICWIKKGYKDGKTGSWMD